MTKTETLRQSAAASNEAQITHLAAQIEAVRHAKLSSAEELATMLEPLAQAMAALTDETRQSLAQSEARSREQGEAFSRQIHSAEQSLNTAASAAQQAATSLNEAGRRLEWRFYALVILTGILTGLVTAALVSGFWLWVKPPEINLDAKAVALHLKPAVIEALKPSRNR